MSPQILALSGNVISILMVCSLATCGACMLPEFVKRLLS
jgi:hypothetical protein